MCCTDLTIPIPATILAHGDDPGCWYPAKMQSSRNGVSGSSSIFILSLAGLLVNTIGGKSQRSIPRSMCRLTYLSCPSLTDHSRAFEYFVRTSVHPSFVLMNCSDELSMVVGIIGKSEDMSEMSKMNSIYILRSLLFSKYLLSFTYSLRWSADTTSK